MDIQYGLQKPSLIPATSKVSAIRLPGGSLLATAWDSEEPRDATCNTISPKWCLFTPFTGKQKPFFATLVLNTTQSWI